MKVHHNDCFSKDGGVMEKEEFRGKVKDLVYESVRDIEECPADEMKLAEIGNSYAGQTTGGDPIIDDWVERGAALGDKILGIPGVLIFGFIAGGIGCFKSIARDLKG